MIGSQKMSFPSRPHISSLLAGGLSLWLGCALVLSGGTSLFDAKLQAYFGVALLGSLICALLSLLGKLPRLGWMVTGLTLGIVFALNGVMALQLTTENLDQKQGVWRVRLAEDMQKTSFGYRAKGVLENISGPSRNVLISLRDDQPELLSGELVEMKGRLRALDLSKKGYWISQGIGLELSHPSEIIRVPASFLDLRDWVIQQRRRVVEMLSDANHPGSDLALALVCGYRAALDQTDDYPNFQLSGLAHLVAVSGAHLSLVSALSAAFLSQWGLSLKLRSVALITVLLAFVFFSGFAISTLRAFAMTCCAILARFAHRRAASLNALGLCIWLFIAFDPWQSLSPSFVLSLASTLGIILFAPLIASWFSRVPEKLQKWVVAPLSLSLASLMLTLPYTAALFSQISLVAPLANIVAAPIFSLSCLCSFLGVLLMLFVPGLSALVMAPLMAPCLLLKMLSRCFASIPHAAIPIDVAMAPMIGLTVACAMLLWRFWPQLTLRFLAKGVGLVLLCTLLAFNLCRLFEKDELIMLDVGQGDAFLLRSQGSAILIDTGNQTGALRKALARHRVFQLDAVIISHSDDDHCGALASLRGLVPIKRVLLFADALECPCESCQELITSSSRTAQELKGLEQGDHLQVGVFELEVLWPKAYADEGGNADSIALEITGPGPHKNRDESQGQEGAQALEAQSQKSKEKPGEVTALLCGDLEVDQLAQIAKPFDLIKVGHHGSRKSLDEDLLRKINPRLALISVGQDNRYGHPSPEVIQLLSQAEIDILRTDRQGDVSVVFSPEGLQLSTRIES